MTIDVVTGTALPWVAWQPLTPGELLAAGLGFAALALASLGLWQMRTASKARNRQLDTQTDTLAAVVRGLEAMIERTRLQVDASAVIPTVESDFGASTGNPT